LFHTKKYTNVPGIFQFTIDYKSYVGSTLNLYNRCFIQHKNQAFTQTKKHKLFYLCVVENGWKDFSFKILPHLLDCEAKKQSVVPNHVEVFTEKYSDLILTDKNIVFLGWHTHKKC
jgi:hypothetical protein